MSPPGASPGTTARWRVGLHTVGNLLRVLVRGGRWWLLPLAVLLLAIGVVLVILQSMPYVAPFVYVVF